MKNVILHAYTEVLKIPANVWKVIPIAAKKSLQRCKALISISPMCYMSVLPFCSKRKWRAHISICHMPWSVATICKLPPAPQEQSLLSPLEALLLPSQNSLTFCPRVFPQNRHFSQKSALKVVKIHALLWAYRGPRERKDASMIAHIRNISVYAHI